jgi:DNA-binding transcriptional regulator GbsR (MarR family)
MTARSRFVEALKKAVHARGMTYAALGGALRLSEASVKRMFSRGSFTLARIEQILGVLELDLHEVARMSRASNGAGLLSLEQESALAKDERLLSIFYLVANEWTFSEILDAFAVSRTELTIAFARLEKVGLIEWRSGDRARLLVPKDFRWRTGGPAKKAYARRVMDEFLHSRFDSPLELMRWESREMSAESAAVMKERLEKMAMEFNKLADADAALPCERRVGVALLAACRPWQFSVLNTLRRRKAA